VTTIMSREIAGMSNAARRHPGKAAEKNRGDNDPGPERAPHQRYRYTTKPPLHELDLQALLVAHDRVERHHTASAPEYQHGDRW